MILLTGVAGFIGMHVAHRLLADGHDVLGVDCMDAPCDGAHTLKDDRLALLAAWPRFEFRRLDLADVGAVAQLFRRASFESVLHLAAQSGMRRSAARAHACVMNNVVGFANVIEHARRHDVGHFLYASSAGGGCASRRLPLSEQRAADHPASLYAATKRGNELLAHSYSHQCRLPTTGVRFFNVYGPWGGPRQATMRYASAIAQGRPIAPAHAGRALRDFTYVDDAVESLTRLLARPATAAPDFSVARPDPASSDAPYRIYNVGNREPAALDEFIGALERAFGRSARRDAALAPRRDTLAGCADTRALEQALDWIPATPLASGVERMVRWYRGYYH
jgi:UDP-glucuronate 4-epimerase